MTACLGGNRCELATGSVTLDDGSVVCNACPEWAAECEAKRLLTYPLRERRDALKKRVDIRGQEAVERLKAIMSRLHAKR